MKEPQSIMSLSVTDPAARDNFNNLNSLFQGDFVRRKGFFNVIVSNYAASGQAWGIYWARTGNVITIDFDRDLVSVASKTNNNNPTIGAPMPLFLRPRADAYFAVPAKIDTATAMATMIVGADGTIVWGGAWLATKLVRLFSTPATYLGN